MKRPAPPPAIAQARALGVRSRDVPTNINPLPQWGAGKTSPALPLTQWAQRTDPVGRPGRPCGGVCPKGEAINPNNVQPVICPSGVDTRYSVRPEEVQPVFSALPVGRYLEEVA